jgi:hypothetical protein
MRNKDKGETKQNHPGFEFKHRQVNDSSRSNQERTTWFLNLPLDESIDNKSTKFEVQIQDPMKHI